MTAVHDQRIADIPKSMPLSRVLRLLLGVFMIAAITPPLLSASGAGRMRVAAVFAALVAGYTVVHYLVGRYFGWLHPWLGSVIAVTPVFLVFLLGGVYMVGAIGFIGLSLVLIAALGHPGCEVLAFPALILGRRTHLACILFSPLDWIEGKLMALFRGAPA
jgi:hypothetical protein